MRELYLADKELRAEVKAQEDTEALEAETEAGTMEAEAVAWGEAAVEAKAEEEAQGEAAVEHEEEAIVVGADAEAHGEAAVDAEVEAVKAKRSWCQRRNGRGAPDSPPLRQHRPLKSHRLSALGRQGASCK